MPIENSVVASRYPCLKGACFKIILVSRHFFGEISFCWA